MHALEPVTGWRVVAAPSALDAVAWPADAVVLRLAPDEVLVLCAAGINGADAHTAPAVADVHAIVEPDHGWSVRWFTAAEFERVVVPLVEWELPAANTVGQGRIAGVPAKVLVGAHSVLLACQTCYARELAERLVAS